MFFFVKQKTAYEMRISDWSSDVCSSDLPNSMIGRAYASYLDSAAIEAKGLAPIESWLNKIRAVDKAGLAKLLAEADRSGIQHFFGGYVGQDDKNPEVYIYTMFQGGIGMPDRDFYMKENERNTKLQAAYLTHQIGRA